MPYSTQDTNQYRDRNLPSSLRSSGGPDTGRDAYEYGTIVGVSRTGRYKVFANPFTAAPSVVVTPINTAPTGTCVPRFIGTPNVGSFRVATAVGAIGGSFQLHYVAFGKR